jgi:hypothetical protein
LGLDFICLPLALGSGLPEEIGVEQYKIGSGSLNEFPDLGENCTNWKPVIYLQA